MMETAVVIVIVTIAFIYCVVRIKNAIASAVAKPRTNGLSCGGCHANGCGLKKKFPVSRWNN
jgi:hypothetical protein